MKNILKLSALLFVCFLSGNLKSQNGKRSFVSNKDVFGTRVFIENKGQYDNSINSKEKINYALENGEEKIYFTSKGLIYKQVKKYPMSEEMREAMEHGEKVKNKPDDVYFIEMTWANANPTILIEEGDKQNHYFTYGGSKFKAKTFKKITYKNVYNGIDFEYTIPENKEHGIKYNVIIHPGANASEIKMLYSGDVKKIKKNTEGNIVIKAELSDITEYAPVSFYDDKKNVVTTLEVNKNALSFNFPDGYDHSRTLTIDPWITMISSLSTNNYGFDVDFDYAGNTYVYGGNTPFKISMYNPSGTLQWTFGGTVVTPAWNPSVYVSNFVVNKSTGKCYVGQGVGTGGVRLIRIDNLGVYDNFITPANPNWLECWDMGFHCTTGDIYAFGGGVSGNLSAGIVNQITAACTPTTFFPSYTSGGQDIASHAIDDFGNPFVYYSQSLGWSSALLNNKIVRLNSAFSSTVWVQPSTYTTLDEAENKNYYVGAGIITSGSLSSNGFNCLAVNSNYLFFYDGFNLAAYSKTTGVKIAFTTIPGYTALAQGGIAVDDCDNVYVGGNGSVLSYSFNGTGFISNPSIPLGATSTNKYVYDIKLNKATSLLYVSGSGFVGTYNAIPCAYNAVLTSSMTVCAGTNVQLNAPPSTSYTWTGPGGFTSSIQNPTVTTITTALAGAYSVVIAPSFCSTSTLAIVNVSVTPFPIPVATNAGPYCAGDTIQLSVGTYSNYVWTGPGGFSSNLQNPFITNATSSMSGTYFVAVSNSSCNVTASTSVIVGNFPILSVTASNGGVIGCNPSTLSLTVVNSNTSVVNPSYTWSSLTTTGTPISTNSFIAVGAPGGSNTLTVYGSDPLNSACFSSATIAITQNTTAPLINVNPISQSLTCNGGCKTFTATTTTTTNIIGTWDGPSGQIVPPTGTPMILCANAPGTYTANFCSTINGCCATSTVSVASNTSIPTISVNVATTNGFTINCTNPNVVMNINSSGTLAPIGYTWTPLANPSASVANTIGGYTATVPGQYEATFHDGNWCYVTTTVNIYIDTLRPSPFSATNLPSNSYTINCYNPTLVATGLTNPLLGSSNYSWTVPGPLTFPSNTIMVSMGTFTGTTTSINYTVSAIGSNGCVGKQRVTFYKDATVPNYVPVSTPSTGITCVNSCVALSPSSTSTVPITYTFTSPPPTQTATTSGALMCVPGAYTMNYINLLNGCPGTSTTNVAQNVVPPAIVPLPNVILPCGQTTTVITAGTLTTSPTYSYSWVGPIGSAMSCLGGTACASPSVNMPGYYEVTILNTANGCLSLNSVIVESGSLSVGFTANPNSGFAPLNVEFINTSQIGSTTTGSVLTQWTYGNGITYTYSSASSATAGVLANGNTIYQSAGTYTVQLFVTQIVGTVSCVGTATAIINVELPSELIIPNVFTPNGDGVNDFFFLQTTNLTEINCVIYDRWGVKMYETTSENGNISWDGKNLSKKEVPDGTYFYIINAKGLDDRDYEYKGALTLFR